MQNFIALNKRYQNPQGVAILYLLGWLAACDGRVDDDEKALLNELASSLLNDRGAGAVFLPIVQKAETSDITIACFQIRSNTDASKAHLLFELILAMAMVDGVFSVGENHIVRFLADVLGLTKMQYVSSFQSVTGRAPQDPSDLSKASWWNDRDRQRRDREAKERERREQDERRRANQGRQSSSQGGGGTTPPPASGGTSRRSEALRHLGLGPDATPQEIKEAYKRLSKIHHPDRFEGLSAEILEAATLSFRRIRESYEYLIP